MIPACNLGEINYRLKSFCLDPNKMSLVVKSGYSNTDAQKITDFFIGKISDLRSNKLYYGDSQEKHLLDAAEAHLNAVISFNSESLNEGFVICQKNPMVINISKLDRLLAAQKAIGFYKKQPLTCEDVKRRYKVGFSKDTAGKWLYESTHTERKLKAKNENSLKAGDSAAAKPISKLHRLNNSTLGPLACLLYPEEVDFFNNSNVHKQMARLDEHVWVDPITKHHKVHFNGVLTDVNRIADELDITKKGSLYSKDGSTRYFYCQNKGITAFDPSTWTELPVFRQRKHARSIDDYRLVIKTIINEKNNVKHTWIELKSATSVYNVGYFWDERDQLTRPWLAKSMRGMLFSLDKNELIEKEKDIQKTVCSITKEQFEKLKSEVEKFQNDPKQKIFNLINNNCTSWVRNIVATIGIDISSRQNAIGVLTDVEIQNCLPEDSSLIEIENCLYTFSSCFRNCLVFLLGGTDATISKSEFDINDLPIRGIQDMFSIDRTLVDCPKRVRQWQDAVNSDRILKEEKLKACPEFNTMSELKKESELFKVRTALPVDVRLFKASRMF